MRLSSLLFTKERIEHFIRTNLNSNKDMGRDKENRKEREKNK
jgi:hypothetical protein